MQHSFYVCPFPGVAAAQRVRADDRAIVQRERVRRAVHDPLAGDGRSRPAAKLADVSQPTVDLCKKIFKTHFAQCHTAWKRDFVF